MECVEGKLRGILQDLVTTDEEGGKKYPSIDQMKKTIEDALEVTPQEKCKRLQKLRIRKGESIQNFNWRYKKLYNCNGGASIVTAGRGIETHKRRKLNRFTLSV